MKAIVPVCDNVCDYLRVLGDSVDDVILMLAVSDDASIYYKNIDFGPFLDFVERELDFRQGYAAIIDVAERRVNSNKGQHVTASYSYGDIQLVAESFGFVKWSEPGDAWFKVGEEHLRLYGNRGLNFCIYSKAKKSVMDYFSVDSYADKSLKLRRYNEKLLPVLSEEGDSEAQLLLGRKQRDEGNIDEAIHWMKEAHNNGMRVETELVDLLDLRMKDDVAMMKRLLDSSLIKNASINARLGRMYRDGQLPDSSGFESIKYMGKAASSDPAFLREFIEVLLHQNNKDYIKMAFRMYSKPLDFRRHADSVIALRKAGVGIGMYSDLTIDWLRRSNAHESPNLRLPFLDFLAARHEPQDIAEIESISSEYKSAYATACLAKIRFNEHSSNDAKALDRLVCPYVNDSKTLEVYLKVKESLFEPGTIAIAVNPSDLPRCVVYLLQYNIRPDSYLDVDNENPAYAMMMRQATTWDPLFRDKTRIVTTREFHKKNKGLMKTCDRIFYFDEVGSDKSIFIKQPVSNSVSPQDYNNGNKGFPVDFSPINDKSTFCIHRDGFIEFMHVNVFLDYIRTGSEIFESLDKGWRWILSRWDNVGDVFKIAALVEAYKEETGVQNVGMIVRDKLATISDVFPAIDREIILDTEQYLALRTYVQYETKYNDVIRYCSMSWMPFFAVANMNNFSLYLPLKDCSYDNRFESDRFKMLMGVPSDCCFSSITSLLEPESKKVLLNPFGGWIFHENPELQNEIMNQMMSLSIRLSQLGYEVYTNFNNKNRVLPKSQLYKGSVCELAKEIGAFKAVVSVCTGLTDMIALTDCNLYVIYPNDKWSTFFSRRRLRMRNNIFEYVWDGQPDALNKAIVDSIKSRA